MDKILKSKTTLLIVGILFAVFNAIFFIITKAEGEASRWIAFSSINLAFVIVGAMTFIFSLKSKSTLTTLVGALYLAVGYFAVAFIVNLIIIFINAKTFIFTIIINILIVAAFLILFLITYKSFSRVQDNSVRRETRMRELRQTSIQVNTLTYLTNDMEIKNAIKKFKENLDYSSSAGSEATAKTEQQIDEQIETIRTLLSSNADKQAILSAIQMAENLLKTRNQILMASR